MDGPPRRTASLSAGGSAGRGAARAAPRGPFTLPAPGGEGGGGAKKKHCNCKNSRCLKLYCECFASGHYCDGCNCTSCCNNPQHEASRQEAVEATLERNPLAFRPKIGADAGGPGSTGEQPRHHKGCHCKKSGCLKRYCECFQAGVQCSEACRCLDCKNSENGGEGGAAAGALPSRSADVAPIERPPKRLRTALQDRVRRGAGGAEGGGGEGGAGARWGWAGEGDAASAGGRAHNAGAPPAGGAPRVSLPRTVVEPPSHGHPSFSYGYQGAPSAAAALGPHQGPDFQPIQRRRSALTGVVKQAAVGELARLLVMAASQAAAAAHSHAAAAPPVADPSPAPAPASTPAPPAARSPDSLLCDEEADLEEVPGLPDFTMPPPSRPPIHQSPAAPLRSGEAGAYAAQEAAVLSEFGSCLAQIALVGRKRAAQLGLALPEPEDVEPPAPPSEPEEEEGEEEEESEDEELGTRPEDEEFEDTEA